MDSPLITVQEAARQLGIQPATLHDWLGRSRRGILQLRGQRFTINYFQGGPRGQGRIRIPAGEIARLLEAMRVPVLAPPPRLSPLRTSTFPGITVSLGLPHSGAAEHFGDGSGRAGAGS